MREEELASRRQTTSANPKCLPRAQPGWRDKWNDVYREKQFRLFILDEFSSHIQELNYKSQQPQDAMLIRNYQKNAPLYWLAFHSRHDLGKKFWKETKKYNNPQTNLFGLRILWL